MYKVAFPEKIQIPIGLGTNHPPSHPHFKRGSFLNCRVWLMKCWIIRSYKRFDLSASFRSKALQSETLFV